MFRFGVESLLYAYLLLPALLALEWWAAARRRRALDRFGERGRIDRLTAAVSRGGRLTRTVLMLAAVVLLVTALARPQFGDRVDTVRREGQDVVVALDLSASMEAEDIAPNRLAAAKLAVGRLIERLDGDRIGLVAFAGEAFVQSPLTLDYAAAALFLNAMEPDLVPVPGTDLGQAIEVALDGFGEPGDRSRQLVVITDGEDHEGAIDAAVERAADEGVRVYAVGMGSTEGVPIPSFDDSGAPNGFLRDDEGSVVTTRLDDVTLQRVADRTGGAYYHAAAGSGAAFDRLMDELTGDEGGEIESREVTRYEEQYQIFLGLALLLLAAEALIPERRRVADAWIGRLH
ncbi:MAG: VWA domain-containing protein [Acidobacteria bacterium]|nr:VWA domain-containing protein [Acidobacteriota bacterium]